MNDEYHEAAEEENDAKVHAEGFDAYNEDDEGFQDENRDADGNGQEENNTKSHVNEDVNVVEQVVESVVVNNVMPQASQSKSISDKSKESVQENDGSVDDLSTKLSECLKCKGKAILKENKETQTDDKKMMTVEIQTFITGLNRYKTHKEVEYLKQIKDGGVEFKKLKKD